MGKSKNGVVKVGFIGVGGVARWAHLGHLSKWEDVKLAAFADVNKEGVEKAAQEFGAKAYTDYRKMLDKEDLDAVYVCVPPFAHEDQELLVAERKLALFVEKPIATTLEKGREILEAVRKARNVAAVGYNWRACEITKKAREVIGRRPVSAAHAYWVGGMPGVMWWRQQKLSGGQLNEQATHVVDIARHLIGGKVKTVYAAGAKGIAAKRVEKHDVHDNVLATMTFDNGCVCSIATGHLSPQGGRVGVDFLLDEITVSHNNNELRVKHPKGEEVYKNSNKPYEDEDRAFLEAVKKKDPEAVCCTYADAFETHRVTMAANESLETGEAVRL